MWVSGLYISQFFNSLNFFMQCIFDHAFPSPNSSQMFHIYPILCSLFLSKGTRQNTEMKTKANKQKTNKAKNWQNKKMGKKDHKNKNPSSSFSLGQLILGMGTEIIGMGDPPILNTFPSPWLHGWGCSPYRLTSKLCILAGFWLIVDTGEK